jgi:hypothetical protein
MNFFENEKLSAVKAKEQAQWITFGPFVFQATRVLRNSGILSTVEAHREGISGGPYGGSKITGVRRTRFGRSRSASAC